MENKIALIAAMDCEIAFIKENLKGVSTHHFGNVEIYEGTLFGVPVVAGKCGIGKVHAALCTTLLLTHFAPKMVLNLGVAGGLVQGLNIGDIVIAKSAVQHDVDTTAIGDPLGMVSGPNKVHFLADEMWVKRLERAVPASGLTARTSTIASGDQFVHELAHKEKIAKAFLASSCDMEGGAIAQVCDVYGTPYCAYRSISDTLLGNGKEYFENLQVAVDKSNAMLQAFLQEESNV